MISQSSHTSNDSFAWNVSIVFVVCVLVLLPVVWPESFWSLYKFIVKQGIFYTVLVTFFGILIASVLGLLVGVGRAWNSVLNKLLSLYVEIVRGIPLLVQLMYIYFVLGRALHLNRVSAAIIALGFCYGAYMAEIVRSGLLSIPQGQIEAAKALGLTKSQRYKHIIVPQAIRIILPPYGNEFIAMLKDSSLVSVIAVTDIMQRAKEFSAAHFNYFEAYSVAALLYLLLTLISSKFVSLLEKVAAPTDYKKQGKVIKKN